MRRGKSQAGTLALPCFEPLGPARFINVARNRRLSVLVIFYFSCTRAHRLHRAISSQSPIVMQRHRDECPSLARVWRPNRITSATAKLLAQPVQSFSAHPAAEDVKEPVSRPATLHPKSESHWGRSPPWSVRHMQDSTERTPDILIRFTSTEALLPILSSLRGPDGWLARPCMRRTQCRQSR